MSLLWCVVCCVLRAQIKRAYSTRVQSLRCHSLWVLCLFCLCCCIVSSNLYKEERFLLLLFWVSLPSTLFNINS